MVPSRLQKLKTMFIEPPDMHQSWIDDFEKESGMEVIILGDINIDYTGGCTSNQWANMIQEQSHKSLTPLLELHHLHN